MKKAIVPIAILVLAFLIPAVNGLPVDETGGPFPLAGPVGIVSPSNRTYSSNLLTLNVTVIALLASNIALTMAYSLDGKSNQTIPLTIQSHENSFQSTITGTVNLPELPEGSHFITVYERFDITNALPHSATDQDTVYFTINTGSPSIAANQTENSWTEKAAMPTARYNFGAAVVNGKIYAIGGYKTQTDGKSIFPNITDVNEVYDTANDIWLEKAPMPTPVGGFGIAVYQNKIYCIGGGNIVSDRTIAQGVNQVYNPATDSWETKTPMPTPANGLDANVVDDKIYLISGSQNEVYDPTNDSWTTKALMPTATSNYASAIVDNKIYIISGNTGDFAFTNLNQIYDPATDTWSSGAPIPMGVSNAAAGAITGANAPKAIYVMGGSNATYPLNGQYITQVYFPETNSWSTGASMPKDKAGLSVAVVNGILYAIGGGHNIFTPDSTDDMQYTPFGYGTPESPYQSQSASPSPSSSPSPTASPSPSPSPSPNSTTQPSQTVEPTSSPAPSPSQTPTTSPTQTQTQSLPQEAALGTGFAAAIGAVVAFALYIRKRR